MPTSLSAYRQIQFPRWSSPERMIDVRLNIDCDTWDHPDPTKVLAITDRTFLKGTISEIENLLRDEAGSLTPPRRDITMRDLFDYRGTTGSGTPVTEDLAAQHTTFWTEVAKYRTTPTPTNPYPNAFCMMFAQWVPYTLLNPLASGASSIHQADIVGEPLLEQGMHMLFDLGGPNEEELVIGSVVNSGTIRYAFVTPPTNNHAVGEKVWVREIYFVGDFDPDEVPKQRSGILNERTANPLPFQSVTLHLTEAFGRLSKITVEDLVLGSPYNGEYATGRTFDAIQKSDMYGGGTTAYPFYCGYQLVDYDQPIREKQRYIWGSNATTTQFGHAAHAVFFNLTGFFPFRLYGITIETILSLVCRAGGMSFDASNSTTGMAAFWDKWNGLGFIAELASSFHSGGNPFRDLVVNYNYYFGLRPDMDPFLEAGKDPLTKPRRWITSPITVERTAALTAIVADFAVLFGCDIRFAYNQADGTITMTLVNLRELQGAIPDFWRIASAGSVHERANPKRRVEGSNRGDKAKLTSPTRTGDAITQEYALRCRPFGSPDGIYGEQLITDPDLGPKNQSTRFTYWMESDFTKNELHDDPGSDIIFNVDCDGTVDDQNRSTLTVNRTLNPLINPDFSAAYVGQKLAVMSAPNSTIVTERYLIDTFLNADSVKIDGKLAAGTYEVLIGGYDLNPDGWLGGAYLYKPKTTTTNDRLMPDFNSQNFSDPSNWAGFYAISYFGFAPNDVLDNMDKCGNTVWPLVQFYVNEYIGHKLEEDRKYYGIGNADGLIGKLKANATLSEGGKTYRCSKVAPQEFESTTSLTLIEVDSTFPALTEYPAFTVGDAGGGTGGSLTGGSGSFGGSGGSTSDVGGYVRTMPPASGNNTIQAAATGVVPITVKRLATATDDLLDVVQEDGTTKLLHVDYQGNFSAQAATLAGALDMTTHQIHNLTDPTSAQDAATKNYVDLHATSLTAGSGISVSASTGSVTVTNTGVLSFNSRTGAVFSQSGDYDITMISGGLRNAPSATSHNTVQPLNSSTVPMKLMRYGASTTSDLLDVTDEISNNLFRVAGDGQVYCTKTVNISNAPLQITGNGTSVNISNSADATSGTVIWTITNTGTAGRGQASIASNGTVTFGPLDNNQVPTKSFGISGGFSSPFHTVSSNTTLTGAHHCVGVNTGSGNVTITLPAASSSKGVWIRVLKLSAVNTLTVNTAGGNINGAASKSWTAQYTGFDFFCDGSNWYAM